MSRQRDKRGFTLIEMLVVLLIFSLLSIMAYRGLSAILDAREHVSREAEKWQHLTRFFARFEQDASLAMRRPVRTSSGLLPAWMADPDLRRAAYLEFSRAAAGEGDAPLRVGYTLNGNHQIELLLWSSLDVAPGAVPQRYVVYSGVSQLEFTYLDESRNWVDAWPQVGNPETLPRAVQVRIVLDSGEDIVRVFAL